MKIVLIGAGRVAHHFARRLYGAAAEVVQVYAPTLRHAEAVAAQSGCACSAISDLSDLRSNADAYIVAISDDAIANILVELANILPKNSAIVHTSGSVASGVFEPYFTNYGVLYPLQSFSLQSEPNWHTLPICLFTKEKSSFEFWKNIAQLLSDNIHEVNDAQRAVLHIAAVFANNFSNYLYQISENILSQNDLSFDILRPLILETALKVQNHSPTLVQTGPAVRGDAKTIAKHLAYLDDNQPALAALYRQMTTGIEGEKK
jgi:predicted short-subunit dehydrogenase-like oxidoreductase (DUF2520 family)